MSDAPHERIVSAKGGRVVPLEQSQMPLANGVRDVSLRLEILWHDLLCQIETILLVVRDDSCLQAKSDERRRAREDEDDAERAVGQSNLARVGGWRLFPRQGKRGFQMMLREVWDSDVLPVIKRLIWRLAVLLRVRCG